VLTSPTIGTSSQVPLFLIFQSNSHHLQKYHGQQRLYE